MLLQLTQQLLLLLGLCGRCMGQDTDLTRLSLDRDLLRSRRDLPSRSLLLDLQQQQDIYMGEAQGESGEDRCEAEGKQVRWCAPAVCVLCWQACCASVALMWI